MLAEFRFAKLLDRGLSPAEAVDYYFTVVGEWSQSDWAEVRGVNQQSVSENVKQARGKLEGGLDGV